MTSTASAARSTAASATSRRRSSVPRASSSLSGGNYTLRPRGGKSVRTRGRDLKERDPYEQEHIDLIDSIRKGEPLNELKQVAESTMTAILGRMSAYTGKAVTWEQRSTPSWTRTPKSLEFGPPFPCPPVAVPGETPLI